MKNLRIIFMGTPEFAVPSLEILLEDGYKVVGVVTVPDKPAGRGLKLKESPVKQFAVKNRLKVLQPPKLKDPDFLEELRALKADLQVVVAFRILPEVVWGMPRLGTFNLHGSLLPQYRGAAPINWAILNGETQTGVTTFFLKQKVDTGNILFMEEVAIGPDETAGEVHDKLMQIGARLVLKTVRGIEDQDYPMLEQPSEDYLKGAPKIFKEDCKINWTKPLPEVYNHIRGLSPYPTAWTLLQGKILKIFRAIKEPMEHSLIPGTIETDNSTYLRFAAMDGFINVVELQLEGKKRLKVEDFLRGYRIEA